jgi:capsid protein
VPFDPAKPANSAPLSSAEMRAQLTALNTDIQTRATAAALDIAFAQTSNNTNGVNPLSQSADSSYNQTQMQDLLNKLDELINALRR